MAKVGIICDTHFVFCFFFLRQVLGLYIADRGILFSTKRNIGRSDILKSGRGGGQGKSLDYGEFFRWGGGERGRGGGGGEREREKQLTVQVSVLITKRLRASSFRSLLMLLLLV